MTDAEVLAVIRERVKWWRDHGAAQNPTTHPNIVLDDLDPDRIDAAGRLREELAKDLRTVANSNCGPGDWAWERAGSLLAKGWKK